MCVVKLLEYIHEVEHPDDGDSQPYVRSEATRVHEVEHPDDGDGGGGVHSHRVVVAYTYPSVEG
jgi:hypothetical protein